MFLTLSMIFSFLARPFFAIDSPALSNGLVALAFLLMIIGTTNRYARPIQREPTSCSIRTARALIWHIDEVKNRNVERVA